MPSDVLPGFNAADPYQAVGQFAVQINIEEKDQKEFSIATHGVAAIYTKPGGDFAALRRISLRAHSWPNWLYPPSV